MNDEASARARSRRHSGEVVSARVTDVSTASRERVVEFDDPKVRVEWSGEPPAIGSVSSYRVAALLDKTRRILLTPIDDGSDT